MSDMAGNYSPEEAAAIRTAARHLNNTTFLLNLREGLIENLNEAMGEEDTIRISLFAASLAIVEDRMPKNLRTPGV